MLGWLAYGLDLCIVSVLMMGWLRSLLIVLMYVWVVGLNLCGDFVLGYVQLVCWCSLFCGFAIV